MANITSAGSGNSNAGSTWTGGSVPTSSDNAIIQDGHTVTQNAAHTFKSLLVQTGGTWTADGSNHLTLSGENDSDFALQIVDGTYNHANGTVVINNGGGGIAHAAIQAGVANSTTGLYDLTISGGGTTCEIYGDTTIHRNMEAGGSTTVLRGDLTVNGSLSVVGTLNTKYGSTTDRNLTVTNGTTVSGTLTCNASTLNLGIAYTNSNPSLYVSSGGTFNGGTGNHNIGNFQMISSTVTFTTGTTTFSTRNASSYGSFYRNGGTFNSTGGKIVFGDTGNEPRILMRNNTTFYEMEVDGANPLSTFTWGEEYTLTITTNLTIKNGTFDTNNNGAEELDLTVTGDCIVGDGTGSADTAILDGDAGNMSFGSLTIDSDGKYIGTSATTTITSNTATGTRSVYNNGGTFTHNNGTLKINTSANTNYDFDGDDLYNFTLECEDGSGALNCDGEASTPVTVLNNLDIKMGILRTNANSFTIHGNAYVRETSKTNKNKFVAQGANQTVKGLITVEDGAFFDMQNQGSGSFGTLTTGGIRVL